MKNGDVMIDDDDGDDGQEDLLLKKMLCVSKEMLEVEKGTPREVELREEFSRLLDSVDFKSKMLRQQWKTQFEAYEKALAAVEKKP